MRILIIGCGSIGRRHAINCSQLADCGVVDVNPVAAQEVATTCGVRHFDTLDSSLAWKPHGVVIATPHQTHIPLAEKAIVTGAHILIEKPISHATEGVAEFLSAARNHGKHVFVVCNMRFHPGPHTLKRNLHRIGKLLFAHAHFGNYLPNMRPERDYRELYAAHRDQGGGVVLDGIHELDYLTWLFGPVQKVVCVADQLGDLDIDVEDYASMQLSHVSGVASTIHMDYLQQYKRRGCEIIGSEGTLIWQSNGKAPEHCEIKLYETSSGQWTTLTAIDEVDTNQPYRDLMAAFVAALQGKVSDQLLTGEAAMSELQASLAALRSARQNGAFELIRS